MSLYDPLIERDLPAIPEAIRAFRRDHSSDELFASIARFAVLAYAPSQHAKHAVLACVATHELREALGDRYDDAITECAIYAAASRQPWSEPPIGDPPAVGAGQPGALGELFAAIDSGDRLRGERWLAGRLESDSSDSALACDYFTAAANDFEDCGHKLIVAVGAWKLASLFPPQARFATLRIGIWEMTAYRGADYVERGAALDDESLLTRLIGNAVREHGSILGMHAIFLLEAAMEATELSGDPGVLIRVRDYLTNLSRNVDAVSTEPVAAGGAGAIEEIPLYRLARDYAGCPKAHAAAQRLGRRFPAIDCNPIVTAAHDNLAHAASFEEWSFA